MNVREPLRLLIALVAGACCVAAFAPLGYWWLVWPSLFTLLWLHGDLKPGAAFRLGYAWGMGLYLAGISWIYVSLHVYGGMPLWMGSIAVLLFASVLALFVAGPLVLAAIIVPRSRGSRLIVVSALWVVFEWGKSWVLTGFPWLDLGYTQTPSFLFALAPVGGVYLISAYLLCSTAALVFVCHSSAHRLRAILILAPMILIAVASSLLTSVEWSKPVGQPVQIGVVQPNTAIETKWQPEYRDRTMQRLASLTAELANDQGRAVELVVWPETALALYYQQTDRQFWQDLLPSNTNVLTGLVDSPDYEQSYNAALLVCQGEHQLYRKRHLVPFGEYLPLRFLFNWVLEYLELPMSDFSSWSERQTLDCGENLKIGLSICYEDAFAGEHRRFNSDSTILVNISEDAWFGDSLAPWQRLQMAQMRAYELARPMVRSANSGPSAIISEAGEVLVETPQFEAATINQAVQPRTGDTPFSRFGNWIVWLALAVALCFIGLRIKR